MLLQTDPNPSKPQERVTDSRKDRRAASPAMGGGWEKHGAGLCQGGLGSRGRPSTSLRSWTTGLGWGCALGAPRFLKEAGQGPQCCSPLCSAPRQTLPTLLTPYRGEGLQPPQGHVRPQLGSLRHPGTTALDMRRSTLQHPASAWAGSWQCTWLLGDSPILQVTPGPAQGKAPSSRPPHLRPRATSLQRCC